jgi:ABC-type transporter Mla MlaB component
MPQNGSGMRITVKAENEDTATLALSGPLNGAGLGELRREIGRAQRLRKRVTIDLGEVTLLDRYSLAFLAAQTLEDIELLNCPEYIEPWLAKETARAGAA